MGEVKYNWGGRKILLQCKFLLVAWMNASSNLLPNPLRKWYLRCFGIKIGSSSSIHRGCKFFHVGNFKMGDHSVINFGCYLDNRRGIAIGKNVGISHKTRIYTLGHNINSSRLEVKGAPVTIEDDSFIFSNVLIMPGVTIGRGAIVLAGAVVTKDVPAWTIVGGNPAKVVKKCTNEVAFFMKFALS